MITDSGLMITDGLKIYLAAPYSHREQSVRERRFNEINRAAGWIMQQGYIVFSPISHSHPIALTISEENALSHEFWLKQDFAFLDWSDEMWVLMLEGWDTSKGVRIEIKYALIHNIEIRYLNPDTKMFT